MLNVRTVTAALALLALAAATPALAKSAAHPGYEARAQAFQADAADGSMNGQRATALHECNDLAGKFSQSTWGNVSSDQYRACMAEHGQPE